MFQALEDLDPPAHETYSNYNYNAMFYKFHESDYGFANIPGTFWVTSTLHGMLRDPDRGHTCIYYIPASMIPCA